MRTFEVCLGLALMTPVLLSQSFTAAQALAGRSAYLGNCASCHLADLSGRNEAHTLTGGNFQNVWRDRTVNQLTRYMQQTMPPGNAGGLDEETYVALSAFILEANGATAGNEPLTVNSRIRIGSISNGQMPTALRELLNSPQSDQAGASTRARPKGHTVRGSVKNYRPVTDAMLRDPDPSDWLMVRGNYRGWSYSPLNQITAANVKGLRLKWAWAMNDGGANQPSPVVHDGLRAASPSGATTFTSLAPMHACTRWMPAPAASSGKPTWPRLSAAIAARPEQSPSMARSSRG
jgi:alcohol dehydrogenase (cytochrome c)